MTISVGDQFPDDAAIMQHAIEIAQQGIGYVEPNPAVGAVIVDDDRRLIASGYHRKFGGAHAEVNAIAAADGQTQGRQLFVTLEPCSHHGKTPPCADAVVEAGFRRVVIGCPDPAPHTSGNGIRRLKDAGIEVDVGLCEVAARELIAPFTMLQLHGRPWIHAKWAMTLDGRIASRTGHSKWISNEESRAEVHRLRGRMDAIITGSGTVRADDPLLTARPPGPRSPLRIVVDSSGTAVRPDSQLARTAADIPVLVCVRQECLDHDHSECLRAAGIEVFVTDGDRRDQLESLAKELGRRDITNVLVEAGGGLVGQFFDAELIDEVHTFVAAKIVGSDQAKPAIGGAGLSQIPELDSLRNVQIKVFGTNVLISGRVARD